MPDSLKFSNPDDFEKHIADYVSMPGAVACQSGTAGLHIALLLCGVTREDMVLVPRSLLIDLKDVSDKLEGLI